MTAPMCASVRRQSRPTRRRTGRFADSARRKAFSRSSATSIRVARAVNLTPEEFRRRNFLHKDQTTATGQVIHEAVDLDGLLDRAFRESDYHAKRERFARENPGASIKRGIGFASFMHGAGFTGSGEVYSGIGGGGGSDSGRQCPHPGREHGNRTRHEHDLLADRRRRSGHRLRPHRNCAARYGRRAQQRADRRVAHVDGGRQTRGSCGARAEATRWSRAALLCDACTEDEFVRACRRYIETRGPLRSRSQYEPPPGLHWDDATYSGDAYGAYAWAVYVAEVAVDTVTFETRVTDFVAVQEVGKVIHPVLAAGQIEGGVAQAIGMTLYENVVWREGRMANGQMTNYIMPTAADIPPIRVFFEEHPYPFGPAARKGSANCPWMVPRPRS